MFDGQECHEVQVTFVLMKVDLIARIVGRVDVCNKLYAYPFV